jgi:hypothetical protein
VTTQVVAIFVVIANHVTESDHTLQRLYDLISMLMGLSSVEHVSVLHLLFRHYDWTLDVQTSHASKTKVFYINRSEACLREFSLF